MKINNNMGIAFVDLPSGKRLHNYGKSPFSMAKPTISMAVFYSYVTNYQSVGFKLPVSFLSLHDYHLSSLYLQHPKCIFFEDFAKL